MVIFLLIIPNKHIGFRIIFFCFIDRIVFSYYLDWKVEHNKNKNEIIDLSFGLNNIFNLYTIFPTIKPGNQIPSWLNDCGRYKS